VGAFAAGSVVVAAVSGGPDSVVLAAVLDRVGAADGVEVVFGHVNHGIRESAWQDECVVLALGARLGRRVIVAAPAPGGDDEAALRAARYGALEAMARETGARAVAVAHVAEDQTETVLLALFRGTGLEGLGGMAPVRPLAEGIDLVRPFLRLDRSTLRSELGRVGLPYVLDPTNADRRYRRNALRARLDGLREEFPQLDAAVARCAEIVRSELAGDPRAQDRRALRRQLRERDLLRDVPFERIEAALDAGPEGRVFLKPGVDVVGGEVRARGDR
jgi:tRNA(Ile)-lysidine synthase